MGRGKVELKWIEDKVSRHVSFSKRRNGLMKKAYELSVLCDVDLALFVFSGSNRLYEFSTGESMIEILTRYQEYKHADEAFQGTSQEIHTLRSRDELTADELKQMIQWQIEERKIHQSDVSKLSHLERNLQSALRQVKNRKTELMMGALTALREKQKKLQKEKRLLVEEIKAARLTGGNVDG